MDSDEDMRRGEDSGDEGTGDQITLDVRGAKKRTEEAVIHLLPCEIHHNGPAKVNSIPPLSRSQTGLTRKAICTYPFHCPGVVVFPG